MTTILLYPTVLRELVFLCVCHFSVQCCVLCLLNTWIASAHITARAARLVRPCWRATSPIWPARQKACSPRVLMSCIST